MTPSQVRVAVLNAAPLYPASPDARDAPHVDPAQLAAVVRVEVLDVLRELIEPIVDSLRQETRDKIDGRMTMMTFLPWHSLLDVINEAARERAPAETRETDSGGANPENSQPSDRHSEESPRTAQASGTASPATPGDLKRRLCILAQKIDDGDCHELAQPLARAAAAEIDRLTAALQAAQAALVGARHWLITREWIGEGEYDTKAHWRVRCSVCRAGSDEPAPIAHEQDCAMAAALQGAREQEGERK